MFHPLFAPTNCKPFICLSYGLGLFGPSIEIRDFPRPSHLSPPGSIPLVFSSLFFKTGKVPGVLSRRLPGLVRMVDFIFSQSGSPRRILLSTFYPVSSISPVAGRVSFFCFS